MQNRFMSDDQYAGIMEAMLTFHQATAEKFDRIDARFEGIDARFQRLIEDMNRRFDRVDDRFDRMDARFDAFEGRTVQLEKVVFDEPTA